jgi:hypothetical protein
VWSAAKCCKGQRRTTYQKTTLRAMSVALAAFSCSAGVAAGSLSDDGGTVNDQPDAEWPAGRQPLLHCTVHLGSGQGRPLHYKETRVISVVGAGVPARYLRKS